MTLARHLAADDHRARLDRMSREELIEEALRIRANRDAVAHLAASYADLVQLGRRRELRVILWCVIGIASAAALRWLF